MDEQESRLRIEQLNDVFRPAGPVDDDQLFTGREAQRDRIAAAIATPGQHVAVYGERGIGKTSLAAVSMNTARARGLIAMRVNCSPDDDFQLIWDAVCDQVVEQTDMPWWNPDWNPHSEAFLEIMGRETSVLAEPDRIRLGLARLSQATRVVIFLDEYDQVEDEQVSRMMASTIKTLSDHLVNATIVVIGVARDIGDLIAGHQSIQRCLDQVPMPRMDASEITAIVRRGLTALNMEADSEVLDFIYRASLGFPQYGHLLGRAFAKAAIRRSEHTITMEDLPVALEDAVSGVEESVRTDYNDAVFSPNRTALYRQVILACALASMDSLGFFTPKDLSATISALLGRTVKSDTYNGHLKEFCETRGPLLERRGQRNRWRYRFIDPAMPPYIVLLGAMDGLVAFRGEEQQAATKQTSSRSRRSEPPAKQERLF